MATTYIMTKVYREITVSDVRYLVDKEFFLKGNIMNREHIPKQ